MGISTFVLFKQGEEMKARDLLLKIREMCMSEGLFFSHKYDEQDDFGELIFCSIYLSDIPLEDNYSRQIAWNLYDKSYEHQTVDFSWDEPEKSYFKAIVSDDFYENEDLLYKIVYGILRICPSSKIWIEDDWFYTLEDLEKISSMPFNEEWCYQKPKGL